MNKYLLVLQFALTFFYAQSQVQLNNQLFGSAGKSFQVGNVMLDFSAGETFTNYYLSPVILLTQGFQQPTNKKNINTIFNNNLIGLNEWNESYLKVFPNPFSTTIMIEKEDNTFLNCEVVDITSRSVYRFFLNKQLTEIDLSFLCSGKYNLIFTDEAQNQFITPIIKIY
jgi:hypothetical protein